MNTKHKVNIFRNIAITIICLTLSAAIGTMAATSFTCGVGLLRGTETWCGLGYIWIVAIPIAVAVALVLGTPLCLIFYWLRLKAWWQYTVAGVLVATPVWASLAQPFASARWQQSGFYDTLNYLGSGALSALAFHFLVPKVSRTRSPAQPGTQAKA